jgi:hypothetical protein
MWLDQSTYVRGFEVRLVCRMCSHPNRAMDIGGHHTYNIAGEYLDSGIVGLLADY